MTEIELHIHIRKDGQLLLNPGSASLLRWIDQTGSLLTASKHSGMSYAKAWSMLEQINTRSNNPVVEKVRGGKSGGGAILTRFGKLILEEYTVIENAVTKFSLKLNAEINM